jgi:hypothetical protein
MKKLARTRRPSRDRGRARKTLLAVEALEPKQLLASTITIATGGSSSIPAGATTFQDTSSYTIAPSALVGTDAPVTLEANTSITFSNAVTDMPYSLEALSLGSIAVDANISTATQADITLYADNSGTSGTAAQIGVTVTSATVDSGGNLTVEGIGYSSGSSLAALGVDLSSGTLEVSGGGSVDVTGGVTVGDYGDNVGVQVGAGSAIEATSGDITVTGTSLGAAADQGNDYGVYVDGGTIATTTGAVGVTGTGGAGTEGNLGVYLSGSGSIGSTDGDITVTGTGGGTGDTSSINDGVAIGNGLIAATGTGDVTIVGNGGVGNQYNEGVVLDSGASATTAAGNLTTTGTGGSEAGATHEFGVHSDGTVTAGGAGKLNITGYGGGGGVDGQYNIGVYVYNTPIGSGGGDVTIAGTGGSGWQCDYGVELTDLNVESGGNGDVSVTGTAGPGVLSSSVSDTIEVDDGVLVNSSTISVSGTGDVTVTGTGGGSDYYESYCRGVEVNGGSITSNGAGSVTVTGNGGASLNGQGNAGVEFDSGGIVSYGAIAVTGTGGDSGGGLDNRGVYLQSGVMIQAFGSAPLTMLGTGGTGNETDIGVQNDGGGIESLNGGDVSITGTGGAGAGSNWGVFFQYSGGAAAQATTFSGDLTITGTGGSAAGGSGETGIYLTGATVETGGQGTLSLIGYGGDGGANGSGNDGIKLVGGTITTGGDAATISGTGGAGDNGDYGVYFDGALLDPGTNVDLAVTGIAGSETSAGQSASSNQGIHAINSMIETSGTGELTISAQGGAAAGYQSYGDGLYLYNTTFGSSGTGSVTITGTGGASADGQKNSGVELTSSSTITSGGGDVSVTGTGGDSGDGQKNDGIDNDASSTIGATGTGHLTVSGTGGTGYLDDFGIALNGTAIHSTGTGDVTVTGTGGSGPLSGDLLSEYNRGIFADDAATIEADNSGSVTVEGTGGASSGRGLYDDGIWLNIATIETSGTGHVSVTGTGGQGGSQAYGIAGYSTGAIESHSGAVTVTGTGGGMLGGIGSDYGVYIDNGFEIASGVATAMPPVVGHQVSITGTGGTGGSDDFGIFISGATVTSTSDQGISLTGTGGQSDTGGDSDGIKINNDSTISETGTGAMTLVGTGGTGIVGQDDGVVISGGSDLETDAGDVNVTGTGGGTIGDGGSDAGVGVYQESLIAASGGGNTTIDGQGGLGGGSTGVVVDGSSGSTHTKITSDGPTVTVLGTGGGQADDSGGDDGVKVGDGALLQGEFGGLTVTGNGGPGDGDCYGVRVTGGATLASSNTIDLHGTGGGHAGDAGGDVGVGVLDGSSVSLGGSLSLYGTGGPGGGHDFGIEVSDDGGATASISGQSMLLNAQGGGSDGSQGYEDGIEVDSGAQITSSAGTLSLTGTGGSHGIGQDDGLRVTDAGSQVISTGAGLIVNATGGGDGNSTGDSGIALLAGGQVIWDGDPSDGMVQFIGNGGIGSGGGNDGLLFDGNSSALKFEAALPADPEVKGFVGQAGSAPGYGVQLGDGGSLVNQAGSGSLTTGFYADTLMADPGSTIDSPDNPVVFAVLTSGEFSGSMTATGFTIGGSGTLTLQAAGTLDVGEVAVAEGTLVLADEPPLALSGPPVSVAAGATLTVGAGSSLPGVALDGGTLDGSNAQGIAGGVTSTGDSTISPGTATAAGLLDVSSLGLVAGDAMAFKLGPQAAAGQQPIPGVDYDQVRVVLPAQGIDLAGVTLGVETLGAIAPEPGTVYTLISNPAGAAIEGTFLDRPEGSIVMVGGVAFTLTYHGGSSGADVVLYDAANTTTTVTGPTSPPTYGQTTTLRASVVGLGTSMVPTGTVVFSLQDGTVLGSSTLDADGVTTLSTPYLPAGTAGVVADFEGSTGFEVSSGSLNQSVAPATPVVELAVANPSTPAGQPVILTGAVLASTPGGLAPNGTGTFFDVTTGTTLASAVPLVDGRAVLTIATLAPGAHSIRFTYQSNDANYVGGGSATAATTITGSAAVQGVTLLAPPTAYTQSVVTLTATVVPDPAGTVVFFDGSSMIGSVPLTSTGVATLSLPSLSAGNHAFTAEFIASDGSVAPLTSAVASTSVMTNPLAPVTVATSVTVTPLYLPPPTTIPAWLGGRDTRLRFAVQVVNPAAAGTPPIGTVTILANGRRLRTVTLNAQGRAIVGVRGPEAFKKTIVARYNGGIDGITIYAPSSSAPFVANRAFIYDNSPQAHRSSSAKARSHPSGPAAAFPSRHSATARTSKAGFASLPSIRLGGNPGAGHRPA